MMNPLNLSEANKLNSPEIDKYSTQTSLKSSPQFPATAETEPSSPSPALSPRPSSRSPRRLWIICKIAIFISYKRSSSPSGYHVVDIDHEVLSETNEQGEDDKRKRSPLEEIHCMMREKDLEKLQELGGVEGVSSVYDINLEMVLDVSQHPAHVLDETQNVFKAKPFWSYFFTACSDYSIFLLLASAVLSLFLGIMEEGPKYGWDEGAAILIYTFLLVAVPSILNFYHAKRAEADLLEKKDKGEIHVLRGAEIRKVLVFDISEGDVIYLRQGDQVPADGLYVHGENLLLDDTSNSETSNNLHPFIGFGSKVIQGSGWMIVILRGNETELNRMMGSIRNQPTKENLLNIRIQEPEEYMEKIKLSFSVLIISVLLVRFVCGHDDDEKEVPEFKGKVSLDTSMKIFKAIFYPRGRIKILTSSMAAMVTSIQHGMPFAYTISVHWWNRKLSLKGAIVQNLSACGTMGFATVIIIDVSSCLTCKQVEVDKFYIDDKEIKDEEVSTASQMGFETLREGFGAAVLVHEVSHTPVDESLFSWLKEKWGPAVETTQQKFLIIDSKSLESSFGKCHGVLIKENEDGMKKMHSHWRGAPSMILPMCSNYQDDQGNSHSMDRKNRRRFERRIKEAEHSGLMPLAFAYKQTQAQKVEESELTLSGILCFKYHCQEDIGSAISALKTAGIVIKLVAEDDLMIAKSIAHSFGAYGHGKIDTVIEAATFRDLTDDERKSKVDQIEMMAACLPEDKVQLIRSIKEKQVVAFIGGMPIGDVHAAIEADVRISIGEEMQITEVARLMSDIIISSSTLVQIIVQHGRNMYFNFQKLIQFELTATIAGLLISSFFAIVYGDSPLTAFQLFWVNMIMFFLGLPMLLMEQPDHTLNLIVTVEVPRYASAVTKVIWREIIAQVVYQIVIMLALYYAGDALADDEQIIKPMISNSFILCQVLNVCTALKFQKTSILRNYSFLGALACVLAIQVLLVQFGTSLAFYVKLNGVQWAMCFLLTVPRIVFDRGIRYIIYLLSEMLQILRSAIGVHNLSGMYRSIFLFCVLVFL